MSEGELLRLEAALFRNADGARFVVPDISTDAQRVVLIGAWDPLFRLLAGEGRLDEGSVAIGGEEVGPALRSGKVGVALIPRAWPRRWTVGEYLEVNAELAGLPRAAAMRAPARTLSALGLHPLFSSRRLGSLSAPEGRAVQLGAGVVTDPGVLVVESPLRDLSLAEAGWVLEVFRRAVERRRFVVGMDSDPDNAPARALVHGAESVVRARSGVVEEQAPDCPPSEEPVRRYRLMLAAPSPALVGALTERGWRLEPRGGGPGALAADEGGVEWTAEMPPAGPVRGCLDELLQLSFERDLPILELVPLHPLANLPPA